MPNLKNKVAIVTGASKGIGAATAERLAAEGASVVVNYARGAKEAEGVVSRIRSAGGQAIAVQADLSKPAEARRLFEAAIAKYGKVDILVNNAGIYDFKPLATVTEDHYDSLFNLNVKGLLFASQEAVKTFGENGGSIINVSSLVSTSPMGGASVYSATKAAIDAFTKSWAAELGPKKIRVNSVLPGAIETEGFQAMPGSSELAKVFAAQTPLGRIGTPGEVANVVAFLASNDSGWVTGQLLAATGGAR